MEALIEKHLKNLRTEPDLRAQLAIYEVGRRHRRGRAEGRLSSARVCVCEK